MKHKLHWTHLKDRIVGKVYNGFIIDIEPTDPKIIKQLIMKENKKMKKTTSDNINTTATNKTKLSPPWVTYYRKIEALFKNDPRVRVEFDEGTMEVKIFVDDSIKAMALSHLLNQNVTFGNICMKVTVIPANDHLNDIDLIAIAFAGNDVLKYTKTVDTIFGPKNYAVFKKDVAQFYNDDMTDLHGVTSMLYADIAQDILPPMDDVLINTDSDDFADYVVENNTTM